MAKSALQEADDAPKRRTSARKRAYTQKHKREQRQAAYRDPEKSLKCPECSWRDLKTRIRDGRCRRCGALLSALLSEPPAPLVPRPPTEPPAPRPAEEPAPWRRAASQKGAAKDRADASVESRAPETPAAAGSTLTSRDRVLVALAAHHLPVAEVRACADPKTFLVRLQ